jgi:hypothetical protein
MRIIFFPGMSKTSSGRFTKPSPLERSEQNQTAVFSQKRRLPRSRAPDVAMQTTLMGFHPTSNCQSRMPNVFGQLLGARSDFYKGKHKRAAPVECRAGSKEKAPHQAGLG